MLMFSPPKEVVVHATKPLLVPPLNLVHMNDVYKAIR